MSCLSPRATGEDGGESVGRVDHGVVPGPDHGESVAGGAATPADHTRLFAGHPTCDGSGHGTAAWAGQFSERPDRPIRGGVRVGRRLGEFGIGHTGRWVGHSAYRGVRWGGDQ